jgi:hypothetical protein
LFPWRQASHLNSPARHRDQAGRTVHHDWLIPLLIVVLLPIKILDCLDMLDIVAALLRLIGAVIAGTAKLAAFLIRKLVAAWKPQA